MKKKLKLKHLTVATAATVAGLQFALPTLADTTNNTQAAEIDALKNEIQALSAKVDALENHSTGTNDATTSPAYQALDQKVRILERDRENDQEQAAALAKTQPKIQLDQNGFSFATADTNFVLNVHGVLQVDSRTFFNNPNLAAGNDGFLLRRARPIFTGTVFRNFDFNFTPDFGGSTVQIQDAYINYRFRPELQLQTGKFKSPVGLEQLEWDAYCLFNERTLVTDLVPNRDIGAELHGDLLGGTLSYAAGIFDGAPDYNGTTFNSASGNDKAFAGRLFAQPFKTTDIAALQGLGFGVGGSYEDDRNGASGLTPGYTTDGQEKFFTYGGTAIADGTHWRISPQADYYYGPLGLMAEYAISDQKVSGGTVTGTKPVDLKNSAWEATGSWVLTGEDASYNGVTPLHPFSLHNGNWGAWQVVARYATLDIDNDAFKDGFASAATSASQARAVSIGLNWYLNRDVRVSTSFSHTAFNDAGASATAPVTRHPENVLFTRVQLAF